MTSTGLTAFDMATIGLLLFSGVVGYLRGLLREVFSAGAFVAAALATVFGYPFLKGPAQKLIQPDWMGDVVVVAGLFLVVYVAVRLVASQVATSIRDGFQIGALDRSMGFGFGLLRGLLIMALALIVFQAATPQDRMPKWLTGARTYPLVLNTATTLKAMAPADTAAKLSTDDSHVEKPVSTPSARNGVNIERVKRMDDPRPDDTAPAKPAPKTDPKPETKPAPASQPEDDAAYGARERRSLDQLITTTTE